MSRRKLLFVGFSFVLIIITLLFLQDVVHDVVIVPLGYLLWIGQQLYKSFDQKALWISFLIIFLVAASLSLNISRRQILKTEFVRGGSAKGVRLWKERLQDTKRGEYLKWRLAQRLSGIILEALAYRHGFTSDQVREKLNADSLEIPEAIGVYLKASQRPPTFTGTITDHLFSSSSNPLNLDPAIIADYLENELDIKP